MSTRGYLHCYNPAYMHFYVILKPVYPAFGGTEVWQSMTPEFKWVWKGINPEWCSVEDKGKMKPQQKQVSQLTFGCGIFVIPPAIEKSSATAMYCICSRWRKLRLDSGDVHLCPSWHSKNSHNKISHLQNTQCDQTVYDQLQLLHLSNS